MYAIVLVLNGTVFSRDTDLCSFEVYRDLQLFKFPNRRF